VTWAVELGKAVVVGVQFVMLGVLLAGWKLAGRRSISISRLLLCNQKLFQFKDMGLIE
jgi:hypothetical protein